MAKNWTKLYENYKGLWVALKQDESTVIASGKKLDDVLRKVEAQGYKKPIVTKVPKKDLVYIGGSI
jgi:hypothetical protein